MVLDWIHHGAMLFFGHVGLQTRSCYAWGIPEHFLALQSRFAFAEAVWLNQQDLHRKLAHAPKDQRNKYLCCADRTCLPAHGKLFGETVVLYGDPACEARLLSATDPLYDQTIHVEKLADGKARATFEVTMRRARRPSRPAAFILREPLGSVAQTIEGPKALVVADNFALIPFWPSGAPTPKVGQQFHATVLLQGNAAGATN